MTDDGFERELGDRLRGYESRLPSGEAPRPGTRRTRPPRWALIGVGALAAVASVVAIVAILSQPRQNIGSASPTPSVNTSPTVSPKIPRTPAATPAPTPAPAETYDAGPTATPRSTGSIVRWEETASFGRDGFAEEVLDVTYGGGQFIAIGYREALEFRGQVRPRDNDPLVWVSPDGAAWRSLELGPEFDSAFLNSVIALPGGAAAIYGRIDRDPDEVGTDLVQAAWRSEDGETWTPLDVVVPRTNQGRAEMIGRIVQGPEGYLTLGGGEELWHSADGVHWEVAYRLEEDRPGWTAHLVDFSGGDEGFVATGQRVEVDAEERVYEQVVIASSDGRTWIDAQPANAPRGDSLRVAGVGGDWIIVSEGAGSGTMWFSHDGLTWEERASLVLPQPNVEDAPDAMNGIGALVEVDDRVLVGGNIVVCCHHPTWAGGVWSSLDGSTWERLNFPSDAVVQDAAWHEGVTVVGGWTGADPEARWAARATFWIGIRE